MPSTTTTTTLEPPAETVEIRHAYRQANQRLLDRQSELAELVISDDLDDDEQAKMAELRAQMPTLLAQVAAAHEALPEATEQIVDEGPADRARLELRQQANIGDIFVAVVNRRPVEGAMAELQQELGIPGNEIPIECLVETRARPRTEDRAAVTVPDDIEVDTAMGLGQVFARGATAYLSVPTPTVGTGQRTYPVITSTTAAAEPAKAARVTETDLVLAASELTGSRISARMRYNIEDAARFGQLDGMLRENLRAALSAGLDHRVIATCLAAHTAPSAVADATTWDGYVGLLASSGVIDGLYAHDPGEVRILMHPTALAATIGAIRSGNAADVTAYDALSRLAGGLRASAHMPANRTVNSKTQQSDVLLRKGMMMDAASPIWAGVSIIMDEITSADAGQIVLTANMLSATAVLRSGGFARALVKTS